MVTGSTTIQITTTRARFDYTGNTNVNHISLLLLVYGVPFENIAYNQNIYGVAYTVPRLATLPPIWESFATDKLFLMEVETKTYHEL